MAFPEMENSDRFRQETFLKKDGPKAAAPISLTALSGVEESPS